MSRSDDEDSNLYDQDEDNSITHNSDEEGEDIQYSRKGNVINDDDDDDDDDDEEEEDEDEEEARKIAEGFIVDDEEESDASQEVQVKRKKRKKVEDYDEDLDEEDLDLLEENTGIKLNRSSAPKLKRLKRGREEQSFEKSKTTEDFFSDDEQKYEQDEPAYDNRRRDDYAEDYQDTARYTHRDTYDDMGDFIADEDDDLEEALGERSQVRGYDDDRGRRGKSNKELMEMLPKGISEAVLYDMLEIFGDGTDYEYAMYDDKEIEETHEREPQLEDIFEPSELAERMMTEVDEEIRLRDVPERLQVRYEGLKKSFDPASQEEVHEEAAWISRLMARSRGEEIPTDEFTTAVAHVVRFFTTEFLEVPHIKDHRRDFFTKVDRDSGMSQEILTEKDLWEIYDLDFKYQSFVERKNTLKEFISKCNITDDYVEIMVNRAERVEEIADLTDFITLKFSDAINEMQRQARGPKRPTNKSLYDLSLQTNLHEFLPRFGINAREFGSNYMDGSRRYFPDDNMIDPIVEAEMYINSNFSDAERVLKAARSVLAQEISFDPQVRKAMRRDWEMYANVTVRPTEKGFTAIDEIHPLHPYKYITQKPVTSFVDGQFLSLLKGEEDNLLTIRVDITDYPAWFSRIAEFYISDGFSDSVHQWNEQRKMIIDQALKEHLMPFMGKYVREKLRIEAQEFVCQASFTSLYNKINVGPFRGPESHFKSSLPRVVTVSSGNGSNKDPIVAVFVNQRGKVLDQIQVPNLRDEQYWKDMTEFIKSKKANVLGVAGYNAETRRVIKHMQQMVSELNQSNEHGKIDMVVVDDEAARLYKNSSRAQQEFSEHTETMRYCISLARRLQSPVMEYVGLGRDLLAIHHHDLQHLVPEDTLFFYLERALISVVNDLGFDINAAISSTYLASALQYVCGFGPRKATSILKKIETAGELESRTALVLRKLTPANTFMNCASYLRIRDIDGADILDDTRIHPQDYELARKMAADALEIDEDEMDDYDSKVAVVTRVIKEYPDKLNDLILDDYAIVLRKQYNEPKRQILEHIKLELQGPYHDRRHRYSRPTTEEAFIMVTGETRQTLSEGFIIPAMIVSIRGKFANCLLDSGLDGMIYVDNASDERVMNIGDVLQVGQTVNCKVLRIDRDKFMVDLSCKASDTKPGSDIELRKLPEDAYYNHKEEQKEKEQKRSVRRKKTRSTRVIKHPLFRPFNHMEAEEYLATRQRGDLVIRPSSQGHDHMAITWKVDEDTYQHVDVIEVRNKEDPNAPPRLKIGHHTFDDLDELIVTYIEAVARKVEELMKHPKYHPGGLRNLNDYLNSQTQANPRMSAYGFCQSEKPGYFDLGFKLSARSPPMRWVVRVLPDGYRLRDVSYPQVDDLINGFKKIQISEARKHRK